MAQKHTFGNRTGTAGDHSFVKGGSLAANTASGTDTSAEGSGTTASNDSAHAEGDGTTASGTASHAEGVNTVASNTAAHAEGGASQATATYSHAEGQTTLASGNASHAEGSGTTATNDTSHAEGSGTDATGSSAHSEGSDTTASGTSSHAGGINAVSDHYAEFSRGSNTTAGGSQYGDVSWNRKTTNATPVELFLNGSFTTAGTLRFTVASGSAYTVSLNVTATIETTGECAYWNGFGIIKNVGGTTSLEATFTMTQLIANAALLTATVATTADNTNDSLLITVTGIALTDIRWTAHATYEKIAFA
jgi:hypothetical protein